MSGNPPLSIVTQLFPGVLTSWTVPQIRAALDSHEIGQFADSALLVEAMGRDERVQAVRDTRVLGVLGLDFELEPSDTVNAYTARRAVKDLDAIWYDVFPENVLSSWLSWGLALGVGLMQPRWQRIARTWVPRMEIWHPQFIWYGLQDREFYVSTMEGVRQIVTGTGEWMMLQPYGQRGWMHGIVRSTAEPWLLRRQAMRDWSNFSEVHGQPTALAKMPPGASEKDKNRWFQNVSTRGSRATLVAPDGFDIEYREPMSTTWEAFPGLIEHCNTGITVGWLGQNLTTEVKGGSFAAASVHGQVLAGRKRADVNTLATTIRDQFIKPWAMYMYGDADAAPWPRWMAQEPEDTSAQSVTLKTLADAIASFHASSVPIDIPEIAERFDLPLIDAAPMPDPTPPVPVAPPAPAAGDPAPPPAETHNVLSRRVTKRAAAMQPAFVDGQHYIDDVSDEAKAASVEYMSRDTSTILKAIESAPTFEAMKAILLKAYQGMDPKKLARLIESATVMASLAGRYAVSVEK